MADDRRRRFRRTAPGQYLRNYTFDPDDEDDIHSRFRRTGRGQYERDFAFGQAYRPEGSNLASGGRGFYPQTVAYSYQPEGNRRRITNLEDFGRREPGEIPYRPQVRSRFPRSGFRYGWQGRPYEMRFRYQETRNVSGPYTGVGPRGYRRSDGSIKDDVYRCLTRHGWLDASNIDVEVDNGEVTLWGQVQNRREKRMAEVAVEAVPGVIDIHNRLRIEKREDRPKG